MANKKIFKAIGSVVGTVATLAAAGGAAVAGVVGGAAYAATQAAKNVPTFVDEFGQKYRLKEDEDIEICAEQNTKTKQAMTRLMQGWAAMSPALAAASVVALKDAFDKPDEPKPEPVWNDKFEDEVVSEQTKQHCYMESINRRPRGRGEYGRDRCAELLERAPSQPIRNFSNNFIDSFNARTNKLPF